MAPPKLSSLKQRLAALSQATSSPHSHDTFRRKFTSQWIRGRDLGCDIYQDEDAVQTVLSKMIFQAGVDYETRPMVVLTASALPDPQLFSYDILLSRILAYLNLYVESDYTVIFFAAGGKCTPGWNWVWKAYRSLSRKYRKNLKQLYIVHSSFFTKMLFSLAGAMISPKFFRKIVYVQTLSELAHHLPITQIDIPPAVYQENLKHEDKITLPVPNRSNTFGVPLEELMGYHGERGGVPRVVRDSILFLQETGLQEEGLFRRSPQSSMLRAAQDAYDRGNVVSLHTFGDPHIAAVLIKKFLRDLPEPVFPERLYPTIQRCPIPSSDPSDMSSIHYIREMLLPELAPCTYILLSRVFRLLYDVSLRSSINRMDAHNLAVVLCPNLVKGQNLAKDVMLCAVSAGAYVPPFGSSQAPSEGGGKATLGMIVKLCIERYYEVFDGVQDAAEASTTTLRSDRDTVTSLDGSGSTDVENPLSGEEDEEEIDDAMLVMSIGPSHGRNGSLGGGSESGVWNGTDKARHGKGLAYATLSKGRSGSVPVRRNSKGVGSGVEALGVTAAGFFAPRGGN